MTTIGKRGEERRSLLVEAALDLFSKNGYEGTTTREVAERSGVTEAVVFRYFPCKRDLFDAVIAECGPPRPMIPPDEESPFRSVDSVLRTLLNRHLDSFWANRAGLRMMILEAWRDPEVARSLHEQFADHRGRLESLLQERAASGELKPEMSGAAAEVVAAAASGFLQRSIRTEPQDWDAARSMFVDRLVGVLLNGIREDRPGPAPHPTVSETAR